MRAALWNATNFHVRLKYFPPQYGQISNLSKSTTAKVRESDTASLVELDAVPLTSAVAIEVGLLFCRWDCALRSESTPGCTWSLRNSLSQPSQYFEIPGSRIGKKVRLHLAACRLSQGLRSENCKVKAHKIGGY